MIIPCHNDTRYLRRALAAVKLSSAGFSARILVIIDRCTDESLEVARSVGVETIVKDRAAWRNSLSENLNIGFLRLFEQDYVGVIAADTVIPRNYFEGCVEILESSPGLASICGLMTTERTTLFNRVYSSYETTLERAGLKHGIRASGRVYRMSAVRRLYERTGTVTGDVLAEDTFLDEMLEGSRKVAENLTSLSIRRSGFGKSVKGQLASGMRRRQLDVPISRVLGELARLRLFVLVGFLIYPLVKDRRADHLITSARLHAK